MRERTPGVAGESPVSSSPKPEEFYRSIFEGSTIGVLLVDEQGHVAEANSAASALTGYSREELLRLRISELHRAEDRPDFEAQFQHTLAGANLTAEALLLRQDGSLAPVEFGNRPVVLGGRRFIHSSVRDLSERRRAELALSESEQRFSDLVEFLPQPVFESDPRGNITFANRACYSLFGLEVEDFRRGINAYSFILPEDRRRAQSNFTKSFLGEFTGGNEYALLRKDGKTFPAMIFSSPVIVRGERRGLRGIIVNITPLKSALQALRETEERYRRLIEFSPNAIFIQCEGQIVFVNPAGVRLFGAREVKELEGKRVLDLIHPDCHAMVLDRMRQLQGGASEVPWLEEKYLRLDGSVLEAEVTATAFTYEGKPAAQVIVRDIGERKRAEEELRRLRQAAENSGEVIFMTDRAGTITYVNPEFSALYGYSPEEVVGKTTPRILKSGKVGSHEYAAFWNVILNKQVVKNEIINRTKDGRLLTIEGSANPILDDRGDIIGFLAIQRDITERRQLEDRYHQAQKMEAIGQLAGGVAHDFNNLLTAILGYGELALGQTPPSSPLHRTLQEIITAGERAASLTSQLLAFSRKQILQPRILELNAIIQDTEKMLRRLIGEHIELKTALAPDAGRVKADPGQVQQVILNLAVNARDAMPHGGHLILETQNVELDASYARSHATIQPGPYVLLAITDTGVGIDADTLSHIFEPFFTTKEMGKGTGLGLSTVYGIIQQSGRLINVYSEPRQGSTFKIYFPRVAGEAEPLKPEIPAAHFVNGTENILVVEDEEMIRDLACETLREHGYSVLSAHDGKEALRLMRSVAFPLDLLLTDVVMPHMGGPDLALELLKSHPKIKVLLMSGYTDSAILEQGIDERNASFLQKPFSPSELARKVREVLDAHPKEAAKRGDGDTER